MSRDLLSLPTRRSSDLGIASGNHEFVEIVAHFDVGCRNEHDIKGKRFPNCEIGNPNETVRIARKIKLHPRDFLRWSDHDIFQDRKSTRLNSSHVAISYA